MPSLKTKAVHKVLQEDTYCKATEASWSKHSNEVQSLDVLQRCRRLNQFLAQGLLSEIQIEDLSSSPVKFKRAAARQAHLIASHQHDRNAASDRQAAGQLDSTKESCSSPIRQPLADRITAKESAALLELLAEQEPQQLDSLATSVPATTSSGVVATDTLPSTQVADWESTPEVARSKLQSSALEADDFDIIGLVNSSLRDTSAGNTNIRAVLKQLYAEEQEQAALCIQCAYRCKEARQQLQHMQQQVLSICRQLNSSEQAKRDAPHHQQLACNHKQDSISSAWRGFYGYWGAEAACTIQRHWRRHLLRKQYKQMLEAAVVLQAATRGWLLRSSAENLIAIHRQQQQQRLEQQSKQEQLRQQRQAAAVVLQCGVRGWYARKQLHAEVVYSTCSQVLTVGKDGCSSHQSEGTTGLTAINSAPPVPRNSNTCSTGTPTLSVSNDSRPGSGSDDLGDQTSLRQTAYVDKRTQGRGTGAQDPQEQCNSSSIDDKCSGGCQSFVQEQSQQKQVQQHSKQVSTRTVRDVKHKPVDDAGSNGAVTEADVLQGRQLVVRSAADTRTANQHSDSCNTTGCDADGLTADFIQRAAELSAGEGLQQVDLSVRTTMASSSFRGMKEAMRVIKLKHNVP